MTYSWSPETGAMSGRESIYRIFNFHGKKLSAQAVMYIFEGKFHME